MGGLNYPSESLMKVCKATEKEIQAEKLKSNFFSNESILKKLSVRISGAMVTQHPNIFIHADHAALHKYALIKEICAVFLSIRMKHIAKEKNQEIKKDRIRKKLSRLIIFKHQ